MCVHQLLFLLLFFVVFVVVVVVLFTNELTKGSVESGNHCIHLSPDFTELHI